MVWQETKLDLATPSLRIENPVYGGGGGKDGFRKDDGSAHVLIAAGQLLIRDISFDCKGPLANNIATDDVVTYSAPFYPASVSLGVEDTGDLLASVVRAHPSTYTISTYRYSGGSWAATTAVTPAAGVTPYHTQGHQVMCSPGGIVYLIYQRPDTSSANSVAYVTSSDSMATWGSETSINAVSGEASDFTQDAPASFEGSMSVHRQTDGLMAVSWAMNNAGARQLFWSLQDGLETGFTSTLETVATSLPPVYDLDGAADDSDIHHLVAVEGAARQKLVYFRRTAADTWAKQTIEDSGGPGFYRPRIGCQDDGTPFVLVARHDHTAPGTSYRLMLYYRVGTWWNSLMVTTSTTHRDAHPINLYRAYLPDAGGDWRSSSPTRFGIGVYAKKSGTDPGMTYFRHQDATWYDSPVGDVTLGLEAVPHAAGVLLSYTLTANLGLGSAGSHAGSDWPRAGEVTLGLEAVGAPTVEMSVAVGLGLSQGDPSRDVDSARAVSVGLGLSDSTSSAYDRPRALSVGLGLEAISYPAIHGAPVTLGLEVVALRGGDLRLSASVNLGLGAYAARLLAATSSDACQDTYDPGFSIGDPDSTDTVFLRTLDVPIKSILLPKPAYNDERTIGVNDEVSMAEDGTYVIYRHTPHNQGLTFTWNQLTRLQIIELGEFLRDVAGGVVVLTDHFGLVWHVRILTDVAEFVELLPEKAGSVTLEMEGTHVP